MDGSRVRFHLSHPSYSYWTEDCCGPSSLFTDEGTEAPKRLDFLVLRADVRKYRPEACNSKNTKFLKKIHKVALGKLLSKI